MNTKQLPSSRPTLGRALRMGYRKAKVTSPQKNAVDPTYFARLEYMHDRYHKTYNDLDQEKQGHANVVRQIQDTFYALRTMIGLFFRVLHARVALGHIEEVDRAFYRIDMHVPSTPKIISYDDAYNWSQVIWNGEQNRIAKGGIPITEPTLAELSQSSAQLHQLLEIRSQHEERHGELRLVMNEIVEEGIGFTRRLWNEIEGCLMERHKDKDMVRVQARQYGIVYVNPTTGEIEQDEEPETNIPGNVEELVNGDPPDGSPDTPENPDNNSETPATNPGNQE